MRVAKPGAGRRCACFLCPERVVPLLSDQRVVPGLRVLAADDQIELLRITLGPALDCRPYSPSHPKAHKCAPLTAATEALCNHSLRRPCGSSVP